MGCRALQHHCVVQQEDFPVVIYLQPLLGLIQDGDTPCLSWVPRGVAIPLLPWGGQQRVFKRWDLEPRP